MMLLIICPRTFAANMASVKSKSAEPGTRTELTALRRFGEKLTGILGFQC